MAGQNVPAEMEEYFQENYPKALERVKLLAEKNRSLNDYC